MAKNEAKITFTAQTGPFNKAIQQANNTMSELRAEMKLNETQMKATGVTVEGLENKHGILERQLKASQDKTEALNQKVQKAVEIFGENSVEASKLRTQLLNAQTAEAKMEQAVAQCKAELEKQKNAAKETETATEKLSNTIEKQQSELKKLKSEYSNAVLQYGKTSNEAKSLARQIDTLSSDLAENKKKMDAAENAANKLDKSLDEAGDSAREASEGFTVMKDAMGDLVADGIEKVASGLADIGTDAFVMANDIDKATNTFITKTGASADSAEEFEAAMTNIYNGNYGESFEDIADAMSTVKTSMGDIGTDELERLTTQALVMRDTFDMDVNESIRAVNSMMDQFGITANEAYNLIAQGAQNGLNQNGDLLDTVNEYSVQFKNAGYSAEDMFNMLANGVDAGTWSVDKLGDAVKEFNIRASDGTVGDAIKENAKAFGMTEQEAKSLANQVQNGSVGAYQKLADKLREVDDDTQRYQLGVEMFGTMWEDLGEDAVFALLDTQGEISTTSDALEQINSVKYDDLGSAIEGIKRNLQTSVAEPIKNEVMPAVNEFVQDVDWEGVGQTIGEVMGVAVDAFFGLVEVVKETVQWMNEHKTLCALIATAIGVVAVAIGAYNVVQGIKTAMDAANVTTVWALVSAHIAQAAAAMAAIAPYILIVAAIAAVIAIIVLLIKNWDDVVAACANAWEKVKETLSQWGEWINTNVIQPIVEFFKGLWDGITGVFSNIGDWFSEKFSGAKEKATNAWSDAKSKFATVKDNVTGAFSDVGEWFGTKFTEGKENAVTAWTDITGKFEAVWNSIKTATSNAWDMICNAVQVGIMFVGQVISAAVQIITLPFRFIWENCKEYVFAAWEWIKTKVTEGINAVKITITTVMNAVKMMFSTVWNAIKNVVSTVWNSIKSVVTSAVNAVKTKITTVFKAVQSTVTTIFNAVKSKITTIWNAIKSVITKAVDAIKSVVTKAWNAIKSTITKVLNTIKTTVTNAWNAVKTTITNALNAVKTTVSNAWNTVKTTITNALNAVKSTVTNAWNTIKSTVSNAMNSVKSTMSSAWNAVKSTVSSAISGVKSTISSGLNSAKSTVTSILNSIKSTFSSVWNNCTSVVSNAVSKLKSIMNFSWSLPDLKLPHISISGKFSLNPPSVPKFSIDWYKDGAIFLKPTLFNTPYGMKGVGEAGPEAVLPIEKLQNFISGAIEKNQNVVNLDSIADAIENLANRPNNLYINGRQFAVATAGDGDSVNGLRSSFKNRGLAI